MKQQSLLYLSIILLALFPLQVGAEFIDQDDTRHAVSPIVDVKAVDETQSLIVTTEYPNTCYSSDTSFKQLNGNDELALFNVAEVDQEQVCLRVINYNQFEISLRDLQDRDYRLVDGSNGEPFATLSIDGTEVDIE